MLGEDVIEVTSTRVPGTIEQHGELWERCYEELMERTRLRLEQEVRRLGGGLCTYKKRARRDQT
jgi:hypothetical protein